MASRLPFGSGCLDKTSPNMDELWNSFDDDFDNFFTLDQYFWEQSSAGTPETNEICSQPSQDIPISEIVPFDLSVPSTSSGSTGLFGNSVTSEYSNKSEKIVGCRRRKQFTPYKSPSKDDPSFRGARVFMDFVFDNGVPRFVMKLNFHLGNVRRRFRRRFASRTLVSEKFSNQQDNVCGNPDPQQLVNPPPHEKHCASCNVKKTPLWRDAEDGTPLCNACGIRYKKYKIRCAKCWHIPKKDESSPNCISCGSGFHFVTHKS